MSVRNAVRRKPEEALVASMLEAPASPKSAHVNRVVRALRSTIDDRVAFALRALQVNHPGSAAVVSRQAAAAEESAGLSAARRGGDTFRINTLQRKDMLSVAEAAAAAGVSRETINNWTHARRVLALKGAKRGFVYPKWQFEDSVWEDLPRILEVMRRRDPWAVYLFFTEGDPLLGGRAALTALRAGESGPVLQAAKALAQPAE